jgi:hypothetical protein
MIESDAGETIEVVNICKGVIAHFVETIVSKKRAIGSVRQKGIGEARTGMDLAPHPASGSRTGCC